MNKTLLPDILHHTPAGASTHTVLHYAQEKHEHDGFHAYDWGSDKENYNHHGSYDVPQYSLGDVKTPVALYWSDNDYFAMPGVRFIILVYWTQLTPWMEHSGRQTELNNISGHSRHHDGSA